MENENLKYNFKIYYLLSIFIIINKNELEMNEFDPRSLKLDK
jgi:hypothetical protein